MGLFRSLDFRLDADPDEQPALVAAFELAAGVPHSAKAPSKRHSA